MSLLARIALLLLAETAAVPAVFASQEGRDPRLHDTWVARRRYDGSFLHLVGDSIAGGADAPEGIAIPRDGPAGKEGEILVAFLDALNIKDIDPGGLSAVRSLDGGQTWSTRKPLILAGKRNTGVCIDPALVALPDGRIRLYFVACGEEAIPGEWPPPSREIHSAVSVDGVNFEVEQGFRLSLWGARSPTVVRVLGGEWWMFLSRGEETLLARSPDGLTFTLDPDWTYKDGWAPGAIADGMGGVRLYVTAKDGIREIPVDAAGTMGLATLALTAPPGAGAVADPSPLRLPSGTELLVYRQVPLLSLPKLPPPPPKLQPDPKAGRPVATPPKRRQPAPLGPERPRGTPRRRREGSG